ncbi:hypothetical protein NRB16_18870 [Pseudomonas sp. LJDD11]|uniref:hypothetical protein n=1 Tax=Pseudomonas sp. LJDD11 TaxID=2931984 RepID=UPI00211CA34C|nr:hypothetical protein [Pseudomonas sp. LJDD11]MCQ9425583.1 hypothetical protein [Pseudomonas sp. LJDD11]
MVWDKKPAAAGFVFSAVLQRLVIPQNPYVPFSVRLTKRADLHSQRVLLKIDHDYADSRKFVGGAAKTWLAKVI